MKYDIIFSVLNSKYVHSSLAPWCLYSHLKNEYSAVNARVYESTINVDTNIILNELVSFDSYIYSFTCYIWNIGKTLEIAENLKRNKPESIILLGGPEVSYNCEEILNREKYVDFIICGEGEEPLADFIKEYNGDKNFSSVKGLSYKGNIKEPYISKKEYISPYCSEYFKNLDKKIAYIETSRGCPYRCAFCLSGREGAVRYFSDDRIYKEIALLASSGIKTLKFVDRTFNADYKRANEIFKFIITHSGEAFPGDVCFHFEIAGDILREETFEILSKAPIGLIQLEIGLQSFNEKTLEAINRKTNINKLIVNIKRLLSLKNMHIHIDLIAGLPKEDFISFKETFNKAYSLKADMLQLGFLKVLHGSPLRVNTNKFPCKFKSTAPYEVISTPYISSDELNKIRLVEDALERLYNSSRFLNTLDFIFENSDYKPFDLFYEFGEFISLCKKGISLDEYSYKFFEFLTEKCGFDKSVVRDIMSLDRLCSNKSGKMPHFLKVEDSFYSKIKKFINESGKKSNFVILYTQNKIAFVDSTAKTQKNGNFTPILTDKDEFISKYLISPEQKKQSHRENLQ